MTTLLDIRLPALPNCWDTCGNCASGGLRLAEWLVGEGERLAAEQVLLVIETDKTTLEVPTPYAGRVRERVAKVGDLLDESTLLLRLEVDDGR